MDLGGCTGHNSTYVGRSLKLMPHRQLNAFRLALGAFLGLLLASEALGQEVKIL